MRSLAEWMVALGVVWAAVWLGLPALRSLAPPTSGTFALVESALPDLPAGVPSGAQSVPFLIVDSGMVLERGLPEQAVNAQALARFRAGAPVSEPGVLGERTILAFRSGSSRFWVVLDRTAVGREREVTAIYVR